MTSSSSFVLDGVEFKLSEAYRVNWIPHLPPTFDLKDPEVLLDECDYDFSMEKDILLKFQAKQKEEAERRIRKLEEKERRKKELAERHRQFMLQKEETYKQLNNNTEHNQTDYTEENNKLSRNTFLKDLASSDILTPEKYNSDVKHDSPQKKQWDVHEFENDNQDPFSNAELQTLDDLKELKDVLRNVTPISNVASTTDATSVPKPVPRIRHHSPTIEDDEVNMKITKIHPNDGKHLGIAPAKTALLEEFTDMLTDEVKHVDPTSASPTTKRKNIESASSEASLTAYSLTPAAQTMDSSGISFPPITGVNSMPSLYNSNLQSLSPHISAADNPASVPAPDSKRQDDASRRNVIRQEKKVPTTKRSRSPVFEITDGNVSDNIDSGLSKESDYVNYTPGVGPKPLPRNRAVRSSPNSSVDVSSSSATTSHTPSVLTVKDKVLASKTAAERARFEDTINKALTSLPQLPQTVIKKKPLNARSPSPSTLLPKRTPPSSSSILDGLSQTERNFAKSFVGMGFREEDVIRSMEKHGESHKEVLDHLCKVQCLSEKGFSTTSIEEALDLFQEDVEEAATYLTMERQFSDMGFPRNSIKQALLLHNGDQTKALEELMSGV